MSSNGQNSSPSQEYRSWFFSLTWLGTRSVHEVLPPKAPIKLPSDIPHTRTEQSDDDVTTMPESSTSCNAVMPWTCAALKT